MHDLNTQNPIHPDADVELIVKKSRRTLPYHEAMEAIRNEYYSKGSIAAVISDAGDHWLDLYHHNGVCVCEIQCRKSNNINGLQTF